jgi:hypothetical protein
MHVLQDALEEATAKLPTLFLQNLISKKLREQGIKPKGLSEKIAEHFLAGKPGPFRYSGRKFPKDVSLTFSEADADEIAQAIDRFETQLPRIVQDVARRTAKSVLKTLKSRWPNEHTLQEADLSVFRERLEERWGKPLDQLRMLLTMSREWCQEASERESARKKIKQEQVPELLVRFLVRGCQVTDEIICLLENGFADGAMARWRTLHEITVVAAVIAEHGESIAERYVAHQAVESKRAMDKYLACYEQLGYKPLPLREQKKILQNYDKAVAHYGKPFQSDYGWAASHLKNDRPTFADLEVAAGRAEMRAHYQMGNDNVHAGIKSMFIRLGLLEDYSGLLSGRSNAGLAEPGQNAAHTLTQLSARVCLTEPSFDDLVVGRMLVTLRDEIPRAFYAADMQLRRDDKQARINAPGNRFPGQRESQRTPGRKWQ